MSNCSGVKPGGAEALQCLQRNMAKLSSPCQSAVSALAPPAAPPTATPAAPAAAAAAPAAPQPAAANVAVAAPAAAAAHAPTPDQQAALRQFCGDDYMAKCGNVPPATAQALQCLQSHAADLSPNCRGALALFNPGGTPPAGASSAPPPAASSAPPAAPAAAPAPPPARAVAVKPTAATTTVVVQPTQQQRDAIRQSCQSDFMARCPGVQPGGADALHCLQRNSAQLSTSCKSAVAAVSGGTPASEAATAAAAPAAAAPAAAPNAEQKAAIKAACGRDFMANCRGVTPGGPEAFACLQRNAARLSPDCKGALAAVAGGTTPAAAPAAAAVPAAPPPGPFPLRRAIRERMMMER